MKRVILILSLCVLVFSQTAYSQTRSKVEERFELTSLMFALIGAPEYSQCRIPSYKEDIVNTFARYENSEPIEYVRELREKYHICYDAVSTAAELLELKDGKFRLRPQYKLKDIEKYDDRWTAEQFDKFIRMANRFYKESDFQEWFDSHRDLYAIAEQRMDSLVNSVDTAWFEEFYGKPYDEDIKFYVSMINGPSNYMISEGVLMGIASDAEGLPDTTGTAGYILMHELCHHYSNDIIRGYYSLMIPYAEKILPHVYDKQRAAGYGFVESMIGEWFNELCTMMYYKERDDANVPVYLKIADDKGYIWMGRSMAFMEHFYENRDKYPHIDDFMPQIVAFFNYTADNIETVVKEYEMRSPYITEVYPAMGSDITGYDKIIITFSQPMFGGYSFSGTTGSDDENVKLLPACRAYYIDDYRLAIELEPDKLEPGCTYGLQMNPIFFLADNCHSLVDSCRNLTFTTAPERE